MGDALPFHGGKKQADGLEFVGAPKRSLFRQYTAQFDRPIKTPPAPAEQPRAVAHQQIIETPHTAVLQKKSYHQPQADSYDEAVAVLTPNKPAAVEQLSPRQQAMQLHPPKAVVKHPFARKVVSYVVAVLAFAILAVSLTFLTHNKPVISDSMRKKAGFAIYDIQANPRFVVDKSSLQLTAEGNVVYFVNDSTAKDHYIFSQQKIPVAYADGTAYQAFLSANDKYADSDTKVGKAYFTRPANIGSDVLVVIKTTTSMILIRGPGATSDENWAALLATFVVAK